MDIDGRALLQKFVEGADTIAFLKSLPQFTTESGQTTSLGHCNKVLEMSIDCLLQQHTSCSAALETLHYIGDSAHYLLVVISHACMLAHGFPPSLFIDAVYTTLGIILHKELYVQMGRYKNRSRQWMHGVAATGQSKSPTLKPLIQLLLQALHEETTLAPGAPNDNFHICQHHCRSY